MHATMCRNARETWFDLKSGADQKKERREEPSVSRWLRTREEASKKVKKDVRLPLQNSLDKSSKGYCKRPGPEGYRATMPFSK
mmetsp:Transcript_26784/g.48649  ORF Transcript_26784/g.48649 Transcript_26784/m.48649 type:complete len:83 (-) Transcript_26784:571-819(-)